MSDKDHEIGFKMGWWFGKLPNVFQNTQQYTFKYRLGVLVLYIHIHLVITLDLYKFNLTSI